MEKDERPRFDDERQRFDYETFEDGIRLTGYHGAGRFVKIPGTIGGLPVRSVGTRAFYGSGMEIEKIEVPPEVRIIEAHAFELCISLRELCLSDGLERIGEGALAATAVKELRIPAGVREIEGVRELPCRLEIDPGNPYFSSDGYGLYREDTLISTDPEDHRTSYAVREGTRKIAPDALAGQEFLEETEIPASLTGIPEGAFSTVRNPFSGHGGLRNISVSRQNPSFFSDGTALFRKPDREPDRGLTLMKYFGRNERYEIGDSVGRIAREAFLLSPVKKVVIPESVQSIGPDAFADSALCETVLHGRIICFPQSDSYLLKTLLKQFGAGGRLYDFSESDRILLSRHINPDRVRMMCARLEYPTALTDENRTKFRSAISEKLPEIIAMIAKSNDTELLKQLEKLDFITGERIDRLIDIAGDVRTGRKEVLAELMDFKNRSLGNSEFDFSL
ncbi:MAG: leucine-rich repeat protein [Bilifractor sp.]